MTYSKNGIAKKSFVLIIMINLMFLFVACESKEPTMSEEESWEAVAEYQDAVENSEDGEAMEYLEEQYKLNDVSTIDSLINAIEICAIDPETVDERWNTLRIVMGKEGNTITADAGEERMIEVIRQMIPEDTGLRYNWQSDIEIIAKQGDYGRVTFYWGTSDEYLAGTNGMKDYAVHLTKIN